MQQRVRVSTVPAGDVLLLAVSLRRSAILVQRCVVVYIINNKNLAVQKWLCQNSAQERTRLIRQELTLGRVKVFAAKPGSLGSVPSPHDSRELTL